MVPVMIVLAVAVILSTLPAQAAMTTPLISQMDVGDRSEEVTRLQTLLATDTSIYPEALTTGYYGTLTASAIQRFQCREGIVCSGTAESTGYGRVGPSTLARLNAHVTATGTITGTPGTGAEDVYAPIISSIAVATGTASTTIRWNTNEVTQGRILYQPGFPTMIEGSATMPASVSGNPISSSAQGMTHAISISNLPAATTYHYVIEARDPQGNISYTWPYTFTTP
jgi:peptidoglycan hydrolase-like protein with peptidoglycan-binding domain